MKIVIPHLITNTPYGHLLTTIFHLAHLLLGLFPIALINLSCPVGFTNPVIDNATRAPLRLACGTRISFLLVVVLGAVLVAFPALGCLVVAAFGGAFVDVFAGGMGEEDGFVFRVGFAGASLLLFLWWGRSIGCLLL